jgi:branched-chain amino acid transport system substrate-binding protein
VLIAEAIRTAQQMTGKKVVNGEDVRRGFERSTSPKRAGRKWARELRLAGQAELRRPQRPQRHLAREWDGTKWAIDVPSIEPIKDKVLPLINSAAEDYVKANSRLAEAHRALRQVVVSEITCRLREDRK